MSREEEGWSNREGRMRRRGEAEEERIEGASARQRRIKEEAAFGWIAGFKRF